MKRTIPLIATAIFFLALVMAIGCDKTCIPVTSPGSYTVNTIDPDSSSAYFNQNVVNFNFNQSITNYTGGTNCQSDACSLGVSLQNITPKKISFNYSISFINGTTGNTIFTYKNSASIDSLGNYVVSSVSNNCDVVNAAKLSILLSNISYK